MERGERGFGEENFLATIGRHDDEHNTLPRIGTARPRSRRDLGGNREKRIQAESVLVGRGRGGHGMRSLSPWARYQTRIEESTRRSGEREGRNLRTCTRTHAPLATESATHSATSRRGSSFVYVDDGLSRNLVPLREIQLLGKCGPRGSRDNGFDEKSIILLCCNLTIYMYNKMSYRW